jgi:membrane-associated phospholipid phosphatase
LARLNRVLLGRLSHNRTTFPSGHVAVSAAGALSVFAVSPVAGAALTAVALAIAMGAISGRYHYAIDVIAGIGVGVAVGVIVWLV